MYKYQLYTEIRENSSGNSVHTKQRTVLWSSNDVIKEYKRSFEAIAAEHDQEET